MKAFRNLKIAQKMIIIGLAIFLIPLSICYTLSIKIALSELDRHTLHFAESFNSQIVASLDHFIQDYEGMSVSILVDSELFSYSDKDGRSTTELVNDYDKIRKVLFRLSTLQPDLETASILLKTGDFVQTGASGIRIKDNDIQSENWVLEIPEHEEYFYLVPAHKTDYRDRQTDKTAVTFVRKIMSSGVRYLGALMIDVDPSVIVRLSEEFASAKDKYRMEISIYDSSGRIVYDTRPFKEDSLRTDGFYSKEDFGNEYIVFTGTSGSLGLHVATAIPKASILLDRRPVHIAMGFLAAFCSILIISLVIPVAHSFTKPFADLGFGMSRMKNGEYITMDTYPYSDELGDLIASYNHMVVEMQNLINRVYISEIHQRDSDIIALQSQINPHMLFNTLESIRMKALLNGDAEVSKMISILAKMFRTILDSMNGNHVVKDELNYAEKYIELQNLRENGRFFFSYDVDEELLNLKCIPIFFQPLVENCIEHGQCNDEGKLNIWITGHRQGNNAVFTVTDDGHGMSADSLQAIQNHLQEVREEPDLLSTVKKTNCKTIGMSNILMRLRLDENQNGDVKILYSNEHGTCIEIIMNITLSEEYSEMMDT